MFMSNIMFNSENLHNYSKVTAFLSQRIGFYLPFTLIWNRFLTKGFTERLLLRNQDIYINQVELPSKSDHSKPLKTTDPGHI